MESLVGIQAHSRVARKALNSIMEMSSLIESLGKCTSTKRSTNSNELRVNLLLSIGHNAFHPSGYQSEYREENVEPSCSNVE